MQLIQQRVPQKIDLGAVGTQKFLSTAWELNRFSNPELDNRLLIYYSEYGKCILLAHCRNENEVESIHIVVNFHPLCFLKLKINYLTIT